MPMEIRFDRMDHWPRFDDKRSRSRCHLKCGCLTHVECIKCEVKLCLSTKRNCFFAYHQSGPNEPPHRTKAVEKCGISENPMVVRKSGRNKRLNRMDQSGSGSGAAVAERKRSTFGLNGAYQHTQGGSEKPAHRNNTVARHSDIRESGRNKRSKKNDQLLTGAIERRSMRSSKLLFFDVLGLVKKKET